MPIVFLILMTARVAFALMPYYIAYNIIEPDSFLGVVGVFFLGSVIVPLSLFLLSFIVLFFDRLLNSCRDVKFKNMHADSYDVIEHKASQSSQKNKNYLWVVLIAIILFLVFVFQDLGKQAANNDHDSSQYPYENSFFSDASNKNEFVLPSKDRSTEEASILSMTNLEIIDLVNANKNDYEVLKKLPELGHVRLNQLGKKSVVLQNYGLAALFFEKALNEVPNNAEYLDSFGFANIFIGQYAIADNALADALEANPNRADTYLNIARLSSAQNRPDICRSIIGRYIDLNPKPKVAISTLKKITKDNFDTYLFKSCVKDNITQYEKEMQIEKERLEKERLETEVDNPLDELISDSL